MTKVDLFWITICIMHSLNKALIAAENSRKHKEQVLECFHKSLKK